MIGLVNIMKITKLIKLLAHMFIMITIITAQFMTHEILENLKPLYFLNIILTQLKMFILIIVMRQNVML